MHHQNARDYHHRRDWVINVPIADQPECFDPQVDFCGAWMVAVRLDYHGGHENVKSLY
jgi:hypothetical protein